MIKQNFFEEEIKDMATKLKYEKWSDNELLPKEWMLRTSSDLTKTIYLNDKGEVFSSIAEILIHIDARDMYNSEDLEKMTTLINREAGRRRKETLGMSLVP